MTFGARTMQSAIDVGGRVVWVTGSSRGIGRGIASHLAREGARVVLHGRGHESVVPAFEELSAAGLEVGMVTGDVRSEDECERMVEEVIARFGRLDGVVANVGGAAFRAAAETSAEAFLRQVQLNLVSAFATTRAALPRMHDGGAMVVISATAARSATPDFSAYGASKAALEHLVASLAAEWGPSIRVNAVSPGLILTDGSLNAVFGGDESKVARAGTTTAVGRIGDPEDIAMACHFLLSNAAAYISGATLVVDGGPTDGPTQRILAAIR